MEMNKVLRERTIGELHLFGEVKERYSEERVVLSQDWLMRTHQVKGVGGFCRMRKQPAYRPCLGQDHGFDQKQQGALL